MTFQLKILGCSSAAPAHHRHQTSQFLNIEGQLFLIDCGESTQTQLLKFGLKATRIKGIFISHLHGDHYFGLIGLISSMHLKGRVRDLYIYGPPGLSEIITIQLKYSETRLNYKIHFYEIKSNEPAIIYEDARIWVKAFPLNHRIHCMGFRFEEKVKKRKILKEKIPGKFPIPFLLDLKNGHDITDEQGNIIYKNEDYTLPPPKSRSYAYCSDTKYDESIIDYLQGVDLLYHEATFLSDMEERATATFHSTASQAAIIAKKSQAKELIIGHYSIRYKELDSLLEEAKKVFPATFLAIEGKDYYIDT